MRTEDLDYELPEDLIAHAPAPRRDEARLLVTRLASGAVEHHRIADLPRLLPPGGLIILNDTRVVPARFYARRAATAGRVEGLYLGAAAHGEFQAMLRSGGRLRSGEFLLLEGGHRIELLDKRPDGTWRVRLEGDLSVPNLLEKVGTMPLPPYIQRRRAGPDPRTTLDRERYQTVYARVPGAVAAPTAGLHFTPQLLESLERCGVQRASVTLHIGAGTFAPVRTATIEEHVMHVETFAVPAGTLDRLRDARTQGRVIVPVGTTTVRAIESLPDPLPDHDYAARTDLLIQPGFSFRFTDGLLTNFHLPRSTLLALVAARVGLDRLKHLYRVAIEHRYRFYSYGDAMLILPQ